MKIRECQVVFFVVGLRTGLRDLLCGEGQALALRYCVICCVARDGPSPYVTGDGVRPGPLALAVS